MFSIYPLGANALAIGDACGKLSLVCATANLEGGSERTCYCTYTQETTTYTCGKGFQFDSSTNKCTPTSTEKTITNGRVVYTGTAECDPTETTTEQTCYKSATCDTDCGGGVTATECKNGGFTPLG